jgi:hypothetical protein
VSNAVGCACPFQARCYEQATTARESLQLTEPEFQLSGGGSPTDNRGARQSAPTRDRSSAREESLGFWVDDEARTVTFLDNTPVTVTRVDQFPVPTGAGENRRDEYLIMKEGDIMGVVSEAKAHKERRLTRPPYGQTYRPASQRTWSRGRTQRLGARQWLPRK